MPQRIYQKILRKFVDQVKPQNIDWEAVGKHLDEWVEKAELEYVQ